MASPALISVIVPVYHVEEYLDRAVRSLIDQTYKTLEIILVDDGSPDQCPAMCDVWACRDPRIRVIHKENGGVSSARNAGMRIAAGEWISFVDADDWIHPQFFEILMAEMEKTGGNVISAGHVRTAEEPKPCMLQPDTVTAVSVAPKEYGHWENRFYVWGKLYHKSVLQGMAFDESLSYGEDVLFNIQLLYRPYVCVADVKADLYYYYIRSGSSVSSNRPQKRVRLCRAALAYAESETQERVKAAFLVYAVKRSLSTRFDVRKDAGFRSLKKQCDTVIRDALQESRRINALSAREHAKYSIFYRFPIVYSAFRIVNDPSLLRMKSEKEEQADPE